MTMSLHPVDVKTLQTEAFQIFGKGLPLLTAGDRTGCNTMTIGWGQMGTLWSMPVCTVYVRPSRYTYEFMEKSDYFTVSVLPEGNQEILKLCGTKSGRDMDKFAACGLDVCYGEGDAPYIAQAELVLVCKKVFVQDMQSECVTDERILEHYKPDSGGWHRIYTGEVVAVYSNQ